MTRSKASLALRGKTTMKETCRLEKSGMCEEENSRAQPR
jgi:hypothetical protein